MLTFNYFEMNCLKEKMQLLMKIKIIEHILWQISSFFILKTLILKMTAMLKKQKMNNLLKKCNESYWNFWFFIKKKILKEYWKVNATTELNHIMWKNVNLLSSVNEFSKEFVNMHVISLINMFFKYNQIFFVRKSHDMIMIMTLINLL